MNRIIGTPRCVLPFVVLLMFLQTGLCLGAGNLLCDSGFEQSDPNGAFPDSGCWLSNAIGFGGAGCTTTAARLGQNGLWQYTGVAAVDWFSYLIRTPMPTRANFASAWVQPAPPVLHGLMVPKPE